MMLLAMFVYFFDHLLCNMFQEALKVKCCTMMRDVNMSATPLLVTIRKVRFEQKRYFEVSFGQIATRVISRYYYRIMAVIDLDKGDGGYLAH